MSDVRFLNIDRPRRVFVQNRVRDLPYTQSILASLVDIPMEYVEDEKQIHSRLDRKVDPEAIGKTWLYLAYNPKHFLKVCPGLVPGLACCNLWVLNFASGCNLDCTYCFLQTYLDYSLITHYVNFGDFLKELDELLASRPGQFIRICTGELTDSLSLDHLVGLSARLIPECVARERISLELKTKTANVAALEGQNPSGRVVVSWTVTSDQVSLREEHRSVSLEDRFRAASQVESWGYRVGFHFDPIIHYRGWEGDYQKTVERIFQTVRPESIAWISLGALRFDPQLKSIVQRRFPDSRFVYGEFIPGPDDKMRYPEALRVELFSRMNGWIREFSRGVPVYLCMESYDVWLKVFGQAPSCRAAVAKLLDDSMTCGTSVHSKRR